MLIKASWNDLEWDYNDRIKLRSGVSIPFDTRACMIAQFFNNFSPYFTSRMAINMEQEKLDNKIPNSQIEKQGHTDI